MMREVVSQLVDSLRRETGVPGLAVCVSRGGIAEQAFSGVSCITSGVEMSEKSRFEISCLMKVFTSYVVLEVIRAGILCLRNRVAALIPELNLDPDLELWHLMTHSSGLRGLDVTEMSNRWGMSWKRFSQELGRRRQLFAPGRVFNYDHSEHVILGEVLRRVTGISPTVLIQKHLFSELGVLPVSTSKKASLVKNHVRLRGSNVFAPIELPSFGVFWDASLPDWTLTIEEIALIFGKIFSGWKDIQAHATAFGVEPVPSIPLHSRDCSSDRSEHLPCRFGVLLAEYQNGSVGHNGSSSGQTLGVRYRERDDSLVVVGLNSWDPFIRDNLIRLILNDPETAFIPVQEAANSLGNLDFNSLAGDYVGTFMDRAKVQRSSLGLVIEVGQKKRHPHLITIACQDNSEPQMQCNQPVSVGFHEVDGDIAMFIGMHAYRKTG